MPEEKTTASYVCDFVPRWDTSGSAERANYQLFLSELSDLLSVPRPDPSRSDDRENNYVFERNVTFSHGDGSTRTGRIDLYKRGCFVLEAKQGSGEQEPLPLFPEMFAAPRKGTAVRGTKRWDDAMLKAKGQGKLLVPGLQYCNLRIGKQKIKKPSPSASTRQERLSICIIR